MGELNQKTAFNIDQFEGEVLENLGQGLALVPFGDHRFYYTNTAFDRFFGYQKGELLGEKVSILIPEEIQKEDLELVQNFVREDTKVFFNTTTPLRKLKDGTIKPFHIQLNKIELNGQWFLAALVNDFNQSDLYIKKRKASDFFLSQAEKMAQIGHFEILIDQKNITISPELRKILEIPDNIPAVVEAEDFLQYIHEDDRDFVLKSYKKGIQIKGIIDLSCKIITHKGHEKLIHSTASINNIDANNKPHTVLGIVHDVSNFIDIEANLRALNQELEKRVQERTIELEKSQKLYKLIAQNFPNGEINVFDRKFNYVFVEGMELFKRGITSENLIGTNFLDRLNDDIRDKIKEKLVAVLNGENCSFEQETNGKTFMIYAVGLKDIHNDINQILMVSQNITNLKKAENEMKELLIKEKNLNELKSRFVSMASHEFRTPLTSINNSLSLLSKYIDNPDYTDRSHKHVDRLRKSVHHLSNILNDFLSMDKLVTGNMHIHPSEINLKNEINEVILDLEHVKKKDQTIELKYEGDEVVYQDEHLIKNVMNNLLSNSIKYSHETDNIQVNCSVNSAIKIEVIDHGIGIPKEDQQQMFERFFRANNALNIQGTGLGLSIVKQYMDQIGGRVYFKSTSNIETKFTLEIPLQ